MPFLPPSETVIKFGTHKIPAFQWLEMAFCIRIVQIILICWSVKCIYWYNSEWLFTTVSQQHCILGIYFHLLTKFYCCCNCAECVWEMPASNESLNLHKKNWSGIELQEMIFFSEATVSVFFCGTRNLIQYNKTTFVLMV